MKEKIVAIAIIAVVAIATFAILFVPSKIEAFSGKIKRFNSYEEMVSFIKNNAKGGETQLITFDAEGITLDAQLKAEKDFSTTNVQVEGVDEADIVKTDGEFIYKVTTKNEGEEVFIIKADELKILSSIKVDYSIQGIFINWDKLGIIGSYRWYPILRAEEDKGYYSPKTVLQVYNISDKESPSLYFNYSVSGFYSNSRMINETIYIISNQPIYYYYEEIPLPRIEKNERVNEIPPEEIEYVDAPQNYYAYTIISAINISSGKSSEKTFMLGDSSTIYVSHSNIYLVTTNYWYIWVEGVKPSQETTIYRFKIDGEDIKLEASGSVVGHILNQFSMDEHNGYLRVVTTKRAEWWNGSVSESKNNVYVLDKELKIVGSLEGLAEGEQVYSARFMGNILYLVTFRQIDPLFVIDLSNPFMPVEPGNLKVTGASEYLHIYDEGHLIGVGFEADEEGRRIGLKVALFDVSNFSSPKELSKYVIKEAFSEASWDHHAFLLSKSKNMLVIPVEIWNEFRGVYVFNISAEEGISYRGRISHEQIKEKTYTYNYTYNESDIHYHYLSAKKGDYIKINLKCERDKNWVIDKYDKNVVELIEKNYEANGGEEIYTYLFRIKDNGYAYIEIDLISGDEKYDEFVVDIYSGFDYNYKITRSLYIDDVLYTISNSMIKSNRISDLHEIGAIDLL
ncbi:MAG: beta-propeller domain-containing protein [Thermoplasmatales archaeon]|nr:beta-propeller domain-containing protein [Thermoplasmatales archaeon]